MPSGLLNITALLDKQLMVIVVTSLLALLQELPLIQSPQQTARAFLVAKAVYESQLSGTTLETGSATRAIVALAKGL